MLSRRILAVPLAITLIAAPGCVQKNTAPAAGNVTPADRVLTLQGGGRVPAKVLAKLATAGLQVAQATATPPSFLGTPSPSASASASASPSASASASASPSASASATPQPSASAAPVDILQSIGAGRAVRFVFIGQNGAINGSVRSATTVANGSFSVQFPVASTDTLLVFIDLGRSAGGQAVQLATFISVRSLELNPNQSLVLSPGTTAVALGELELARGNAGGDAADMLAAIGGGSLGDANIGRAIVGLESSVGAETTQQRTALQIDRAGPLIDSIDTLEELDQVPEALGVAFNNAVTRVLKKLDLTTSATLGRLLALARESLEEVLLAAEGRIGPDKNLTTLVAALLAAGDQVAGNADALKRIADDATANLVEVEGGTAAPPAGTALAAPTERTVPAVSESPAPVASSGVGGSAGVPAGGQTSAGGGF